MAIQLNIQIRLFRREDIPALLDIILSSARIDGDDWLPDLEELEHDFQPSVEFSPYTDCFVAVVESGTPQERVVGFSDFDYAADIGRAWRGGYVHPDFRRQGIGTLLLRAAEARILERAAAETASETPIYAQCYIDEQIKPTIALLNHEGYNLIRHGYTMQINLDAPVEAPPLPAGLELRPFDVARDSHAVHAADQDAFSDHWGYHHLPYEEWSLYLLGAPDFDPSLWMIAYDGDEIAGTALCIPRGVNYPGMGWVNRLSVRRPWRKRGLGMALLKHTFAVFQQRGFTSVGLGVDAQNPNNAVALYQRAGMHVHRKANVYRKMLRGNEADIPADR